MPKNVNQRIRTSSDKAQQLRGLLRGNSLAVRVAVFLIMSAGFLLMLAITDKGHPSDPILQAPADSATVPADTAQAS